jgi:hypothetical protein
LERQQQINIAFTNKLELMKFGECLLPLNSEPFCLLVCKNLKIKIYRAIILLYVLYGCETWPLTSGEGHRLRVFENRMLRRIFGPRRDKWQEAGQDYNEMFFRNLTSTATANK